MKQITIVSATQKEVQPLVDFLQVNAVTFTETRFQFLDKQIDILITGIGLLSTTYQLMDYLMSKRPDMWIQIGIGGAFDASLNIGDVFVIESEILVGFGAEEIDGKILSPFSLGWVESNQFPFKDELLVCPHIPMELNLPRASGMTTIHSHGNIRSIAKLSESAFGQIENMEGAAFFYVSLMKKIPFISIRSVSNYVEERNISAWRIPEAVEKLNLEIVELLKSNSV